MLEALLNAVISTWVRELLSNVQLKKEYMKMKKNILLMFVSVLLLSACDDLFSPADENLDRTYVDQKLQGFLLNAYSAIPTYYDNTEYATDDAVTNQKTNTYLKMALGSWSSQSNPVSRWNDAYSALQYVNLFLANVDSVKWAGDSEANALFKRRLKGEAYGLRALFMYHLLRNHAGFTEDGQLLGIQIDTAYQTLSADFNQARATFDACVKQIYRDLDRAELYLPMEYNDLGTTGVVPVKFQDITTSTSVYNRVMGLIARQLFNGLIAKSFRARTALLAASPAFEDASNTSTYAYAADAAAEVIDYNIATNGNAAGFGLATNGATYYGGSSASIAEITAIANASNPKEIIWREVLLTTASSSNNSIQEAENFPPSLGGAGYMNPTQNLVDAFPMANGYPIGYADQSKSGYDANFPYKGRDLRLDSYIIYNGSTGISSTKATIYTSSTDSVSVKSGDGINVRDGYSTRTGYYMKKRLRMDVNRASGSIVGQTHYNPRLRYTEIYLAYAEAANEAWGPKVTGTHTYSAYDIIKAIRKRSNPTTLASSDPYLDECAADKVKMRELIRNERRIELCFESFRFWDLRRWKVANLSETARGMDLSTNKTTGKITYIPMPEVEVRSYEDYMYYGPIPYSEVLKYSNLLQNKGW